jgi:murein L,D-transpeptidase YcbB/YkuD
MRPVLFGVCLLKFIYYTTAIVRQDGTIEFYEDIYGKDEALDRALRARRPAAE